MIIAPSGRDPGLQAQLIWSLQVQSASQPLNPLGIACNHFEPHLQEPVMQLPKHIHWFSIKEKCSWCCGIRWFFGLSRGKEIWLFLASHLIFSYIWLLPGVSKHHAEAKSCPCEAPLWEWRGQCSCWLLWKEWQAKMWRYFSGIVTGTADDQQNGTLGVDIAQCSLDLLKTLNWYVLALKH